ncbi:ExeA family protein [Nitrincola sp.]|uniref:ExeA family protein n=1 Tax=Nitrincola sp. TaxID=1926584 RepID=UPI003A90D6B5
MLTQETLKHFHLFRDPFSDDVRSPEDVYMTQEYRYVLGSMRQAAQAQGIVAVVADSGAGKTTMRRLLMDELRRDGKVSVIMPTIIDKSRVTAAGLCEAIIADVSDETPKRSMEAKARQVERLLRDASRSGQKHVMVIEEAHDLTIPTLRYLKRFWELEDGFTKLLGIVLIGQTELGLKLQEHRNSQARELIRRCITVDLRSLDADLESYLKHKFKRVGADVNALMEPGAFDEIRLRLRRKDNGQVVSDLYPLAINNLVTKAFNVAAGFGDDRVSGEIIKHL